jgi:hypothetical protein
MLWLRDVLHWRVDRAPNALVPENENAPESQPREAVVSTSNVRALATGAALATSLDSSPAVLVTMYDYAHRYRDKGRRSA